MAGERDGDDLNDPSLLQGDDGDDNLDDGTNTDGDLPGDGKADKGGDDDKGAKTRRDDDAGFEIVIEDDAVEGEDGALEDDDDDGTEDAKEKHSKAVRARIERERRIARQARAQADAERSARIQAEQRSIRVQKEALETVEMALDAAMPATLDQLKKAKEEGKTDDEIRLQNMLARQHAQKDGLERAKRQLVEDEEKVKQSAAARPPSQLAQDWKRRNPWYGHDRYNEQSGLTQTIDRQVKAAGFDPEDPEYYAELDRRIRRRMPELQRFQRGGQQQRQPQRRDPAGAVVRRGAPAGGDNGARKGRVVLNRSDLENMKTFGMDPKNPAHQKEYAQQKMGGDNA